MIDDAMIDDKNGNCLSSVGWHPVKRSVGAVHRIIVSSLLFLLALALPDAALAYSPLTCNGPAPNGNLYDTTQTCMGITGLNNLFSGLVCDYQTILDVVMSKVYCGVQFSLNQPLRVAMVLFIIIMGLQLATGMMRPTTSEFFSRGIKLILVWVFATESAYGIGVVYNFFIDSANTGIGWMLAAVPMPSYIPPTDFCQVQPLLPPVSSERVAFQYMDYLICKSVTGPFTAQGAALAGFFGVLSYLIPPLFVMFLYFNIKALTIFIRCLFSYLLCISAIAFMITLSPIFLSLALFKGTYKFFDDWLRYLISFTFQIVLVFAGAALWVTSITQLGAFFEGLASMVRPIGRVNNMAPLRLNVETWGVCQYQMVQTWWGPLIQCIDRQLADGSYFPQPIYPSQLIMHQQFLFFVVLNLLAVCIVAYVFDTLMKLIPDLARKLAGPGYAPVIGGGNAATKGNINFGRLLSMENAGKDSRAFADRLGGLLGNR